MNKIALILFAYKRPRYLRETLEALKGAYIPDLDYFCFIDSSEMQFKIFDIVENARLFDKIVLRKRNYGLTDNIKYGIFEVFENYDAVIVLEDDIVIETDALEYLVTKLNKNDKSIGQINLQGVSVPNSHGWATWKDRWEQIDWDNFPIEGELARLFQKHKTWDIIFAHNLNSLGYKVIGEKKAKHIGRTGEHYKWYSNLSIRKHFREWKKNYYRDKDILMRKDKFPYNIYRWFL